MRGKGAYADVGRGALHLRAHGQNYDRKRGRASRLDRTVAEGQPLCVS